ncbi:AraC family transcriptional regulator [Paenibacillus sp. 7541]|uniref:AraC family transcriptional regulator n=1 Tax=Paenibacillus sp. 7541 TaxID=2026236 RepID=UPI0020D0910B|nr:AraC family transcriptional regulator [Paenibacillus sp. 7541]
MMDDNLPGPSAELVEAMKRYAAADGTHETTIPSLRIIRSSQVSEPVHSVYEPSLCIVAQGAKIAMLGEESYRYDPSSYLTASVHLPIVGQVIEASPEAPYLCLQLQLDRRGLLDVIQTAGLSAPAEPGARRGLVISRMNDGLSDAVIRLVRLLDAPQDIPVLAPMIIREIIYRILQSDQSGSMRQFALIGSHAQRIASVLEQLNRNFAKRLCIDDLAAEAAMSKSSFYEVFNEVTGMSPLRYQKQLRLQEARRLLLSSSMDASDAAFEVGYESPSQFSREYARMYGQPPIRDIRRLRDSL